MVSFIVNFIEVPRLGNFTTECNLSCTFFACCVLMSSSSFHLLIARRLSTYNCICCIQICVVICGHTSGLHCGRSPVKHARRDCDNLALPLKKKSNKMTGASKSLSPKTVNKACSKWKLNCKRSA